MRYPPPIFVMGVKLTFVVFVIWLHLSWGIIARWSTDRNTSHVPFVKSYTKISLEIDVKKGLDKVCNSCYHSLWAYLRGGHKMILKISTNTPADRIQIDGVNYPVDEVVCTIKFHRDLVDSLKAAITWIDDEEWKLGAKRLVARVEGRLK